MAGRIVQEQGYERFVELSADYSSGSYYGGIQVDQTIVGFEQGHITLFKLNSLDDRPTNVITLSEQEMGALVEAYQTYLADMEGKRAAAESAYQARYGSGCGSSEDFPF